MSILIKGMEMPKPKLADMATVYDAYVLVRPNGHAVIVVDSEDGLDSTEYSLVLVPEHGDLINRDKLERDIERYVGGEESRSRFHHWVQVQQVVIPKGETKT